MLKKIFNRIFQLTEKISLSRNMLISIAFLVLSFILVRRMYMLQIVIGDDKSEKSDYYTVKERMIPATRGNIYDVNGKLLAYNELTYSVVIEDSGVLNTNAEKNKVINNLLQILKRYGYGLEQSFPIEIDDNGKLCFNVEDSALLRFKKNAYGLRSVNDLSDEQKKASAEEVFEFLRHGNKTSAMFQVSDDYSLEDALDIVAVRYFFFSTADKTYQFTIATDLNDSVVAAIMESSSDLTGVSVEQQTNRKYNYSKYFAQIIGYTGLATETEINELDDSMKDLYTTSDPIGKKGIEKSFESTLAGKKGVERLTLNASGKIVSSEIISEPVAGEDVYLTLDADAQVVYYYILEKNLANILKHKIVDSMDYGTKGDSSEDITIPIYEVYYAMFNNHMIDFSAFNKPDASVNEKKVYEKYRRKKDSVVIEMKKLLEYGFADTSYYNGTYSSYMSLFLSQATSLSLIDQKKMEADKYYDRYKNKEITLSDLLSYCIVSRYVDVDKLVDDGIYYDTHEIYDLLVQRVIDSFDEYEPFILKIYRDEIFDKTVDGREICLLLFDQNVIKYNADDFRAVEMGQISPYDFVIEKISSIEITAAQLALEPCSGAIVQTDVNSGQVMACVTYPSYDNNKLANKIDWSYYQTLLEDHSNPLYNRATQQRTTTGSSIKMMTSTAGFVYDVLKPDELIEDLVVFSKVVPSPSCSSKIGHGTQDVSDAIKNSCNYFFYEVGYRLATSVNSVLDSDYSDSLGITRLANVGSMFGFTETSGIEIGEADPDFSTSDVVRSAIGYGYKFTPTQISRYANTVATRGKLYKYTLISKIVNKDNEITYRSVPVIESTITELTDYEWDKIVYGMEKVILNSSSLTAGVYSVPVTVAGKTGSAQTGPYTAPHSVFVSFAPSHDPEISVVSVIAGGYSGLYSGLTCADVYRYYYNKDYIQYLDRVQEAD